MKHSSKTIAQNVLYDGLQCRRAPICLEGLKAWSHRNDEKEEVSRSHKQGKVVWKSVPGSPTCSPTPQSCRPPGHCLQDPSQKIISKPGKAMTSFESFGCSAKEFLILAFGYPPELSGSSKPTYHKADLSTCPSLVHGSFRKTLQARKKTLYWTEEETHIFIINM